MTTAEVEGSPAPDPKEVYRRGEVEGHRRLFMSLHDQVMTGFIAGVTVMFGVVALGLVESLVAPRFGSEFAKLAGALAFAIGLVFLVVGRTELFSENFFDPVAAAIKEEGAKPWVRLARLWTTILILNLTGGAVIVALITIDGAVPEGAAHGLVRVAEEIVHKEAPATLARAVLAGALVALMSYMLEAANNVVARILVAYFVGFFLALGPFDHVVVSALHILFGVWDSDAVTYADLFTNIALAAAGNLAGGLLLITLTHTAQVKGG